MFTLRDMAELIAEYLAVIPSGGGLIPHVFEATQLLSSDDNADLSVFTFDGTEYALRLDDNLWWPLDADRTGLTYPVAANAKKLPLINLKQLLKEQHPSTFQDQDFDVVWLKKNGAQGKNVIEPQCRSQDWSYRFQPDTVLNVAWAYPAHTVLRLAPNEAPALCKAHGPRHGIPSSVIVERYDFCSPIEKAPLPKEACEIVYGDQVLDDNPECLVEKRFVLMIDEHGRQKGLEPHCIGGHIFYGTAKVAAYWVAEGDDHEDHDGRIWYCDVEPNDTPYIVSAITSKFVGRKFMTKGFKTRALNDCTANLITSSKKRVARDRIPVKIRRSDGTTREASVKACNLLRLE